MCVLLAALFALVELLINRIVYQKWIIPPVVLDVMWFGVHFFNLLLGWQLDEPAYLILILPPLMFDIGFFLSLKIRHGRISREVINELNVKPDCDVTAFSLNRWFYFFFVANIAIFLVQLLTSGKQILSLGMGNMWQNVHYYSEEIIEQRSNPIMTYSFPACYIFSGFCAINYFLNKRTTNFIIYFIALFIALVRAFIAGNRTSLFMVICINAFSIITLYSSYYSKRKAKISTRRMIVTAGVLSIAMFLYVASMKYTDDFAKLSVFDFISKNLSGYYNLSSAAFVEWFRSSYNSYRLYGRNTFRFVFALLARFGMNTQVVNTTSNWSYVYFNGLTTNACTVATTYIQDFGVPFMAIMLMVFGIIHGSFFRESFLSKKYKRYVFTLMNGALYLGVLYQVLTDQYMNIFSMWLSFFIWSFVYCKACIKKDKR